MVRAHPGGRAFRRLSILSGLVPETSPAGTIPDQLSTCVTTLPSTSVSRKSRPAYR